MYIYLIMNYAYVYHDTFFSLPSSILLGHSISFISNIVHHTPCPEASHHALLGDHAGNGAQWLKPG